MQGDRGTLTEFQFRPAVSREEIDCDLAADELRELASAVATRNALP